MATFYVKAGDRGTSIEVQLRDAGGPPDLSDGDVAVTLRLWRINALAGRRELTATKVDGGSTGRVGYTWQADDLQVAGTYQADWQVKQGDTVIATYPSDGYDTIMVLP